MTAIFYMLITLTRSRVQGRELKPFICESSSRSFVIHRFHIWKRGVRAFSEMNHTYAYLRNKWKIKFRMVSVQHFINVAPVLWFLAKPFRSKNNTFSYHLTTRWRCSETEQVTSDLMCYNTHQVWSQYAKPLWRYSLTSIFACFSSNLFMRYSRMGLTKKTFFPQLFANMFWSLVKFGENQTNHLGRVWKSRFFDLWKITKKTRPYDLFNFGVHSTSIRRKKNIFFILDLMG